MNPKHIILRRDPQFYMPYTAFDFYEGMLYEIDEEKYNHLVAKYNIIYQDSINLKKDYKSIKVPVTESPLKAEIHLTSTCNLACSHCFQAASPKTNKFSTLSYERWKLIFDKLESAKIHRITLSGGEPLYYSECNKVLEDLAKRNLRVEVLTNGLLINSSNVEFLSSPNFICSLSLDGASDETHDMIRGKGTFKRLLKALTLLNKHNATYNLNVTINKKNKDEVDKLISIAREFNAFSISFSALRSLGRAQDNDLSIENPEYIELISKLREYSYLEKPLITLPESPNIDTPAKTSNNNLHKSIYCKGGTESFAIRPDGTVFPCIYAFSNSRFSLGNLYEEDLTCIWNNSNVSPFRGDIKLGDIENCSECSRADKCGANLVCRIKALNAYGSMYAQNPCNAVI